MSSADDAIGQDKVIYNEDEMRRAISRIAHEIVERNAGASNLLLLGMRTRGFPLAQRLAARIAEFENITVPTGMLDPTAYRDDLPERAARVNAPRLPLPVDVKDCV